MGIFPFFTNIIYKRRIPMKYFRITLSLLLVTILMAGMFTGCKNDPESTDTTALPDNTEPQISRDPVGSFVINGGAILELFYNAEGLIVDVASKNSAGTTILDTDPQIFGVGCNEAVLELLPHLNALDHLKNNNYAVLLKSTPGSKEPSETFLTDIEKALQQAATAQELTLKIFALNAKDLNADGEMTASQAKDFLLTVLSLTGDDFDSLDATNQTVQGSYAFQIVVKDLTEGYLVNALTGDIMEGSVDDSFFDNADIDHESELPEETQGDETEPTGESQGFDIEIDLTV